MQQDNNAPIIYGTNQRPQTAAAYVEGQAPKVNAGGQPNTDQPVNNIPKGQTKPIQSKIKSTYLDDEGKSVNVDVQVTTGPTDEGLYIEVLHSPGIIVGLSELAQRLSKSQLETVADQLKRQEASARFATFADYTKSDGAQQFGGMFSEEKLTSLLKQDFLFFGGSGKASLLIPATGFTRVSANLLVLDQRKLMPVLGSSVVLLVPEAK